MIGDDRNMYCVYVRRIVRREVGLDLLHMQAEFKSRSKKYVKASWSVSWIFVRLLFCLSQNLFLQVRQDGQKTPI